MTLILVGTANNDIKNGTLKSERNDEEELRNLESMGTVLRLLQCYERDSVRSRATFHSMIHSYGADVDGLIFSVAS